MITVLARDKNRIVTLSAPGKAPIRVRPSSSPYFWTPMELLCGSVGSCVGGIIVDYCRYNDLDPRIFEFIGADLKDSKIVITLQHPKDLSSEHLSRLSSKISNCEVSKLLVFPIEITLLENSISTKELTDDSKQSRSCCGGN